MTVDEGKDVNISCSANGYPDPRIKWVRGNGVNIPQPYNQFAVAVSQAHDHKSCFVFQVGQLLVAPRATLVIAFGFLSQNFGRWWGSMTAILSFFDRRLSGGDTQILPAVIERV